MGIFFTWFFPSHNCVEFETCHAGKLCQQADSHAVGRLSAVEWGVDPPKIWCETWHLHRLLSVWGPRGYWGCGEKRQIATKNWRHPQSQLCWASLVVLCILCWVEEYWLVVAGVGWWLLLGPAAEHTRHICCSVKLENKQDHSWVGCDWMLCHAAESSLWLHLHVNCLWVCTRGGFCAACTSVWRAMQHVNSCVRLSLVFTVNVQLPEFCKSHLIESNGGL